MDNNASANGGNRGVIEIEGAIELGISGEFGIDMGSTKEIECE